MPGPILLIPETTKEHLRTFLDARTVEDVRGAFENLLDSLNDGGANVRDWIAQECKALQQGLTEACLSTAQELLYTRAGALQGVVSDFSELVDVAESKRTSFREVARAIALNFQDSDFRGLLHKRSVSPKPHGMTM